MFMPRLGMDGPGLACTGIVALAVAGAVDDAGAAAGAATVASAAAGWDAVLAASAVVDAMAWVAVAAAGADWVDAAGLSAMVAAVQIHRPTVKIASRR